MIEYPIFIFDGYSVDIFKTMSDFQKKIEPIDIKSNHFSIFDSQGNTLNFEVTTEKYCHLLPVEKIILKDSYPNYGHFFEKMSMAYQQTFHQHISNMSIQEIQQALMTFYGFTC